MSGSKCNNTPSYFAHPSPADSAQLPLGLDGAERMDALHEEDAKIIDAGLVMIAET